MSHSEFKENLASQVSCWRSAACPVLHLPFVFEQYFPYPCCSSLRVNEVLALEVHKNCSHELAVSLCRNKIPTEVAIPAATLPAHAGRESAVWRCAQRQQIMQIKYSVPLISLVSVISSARLQWF